MPPLSSGPMLPRRGPRPLSSAAEVDQFPAAADAAAEEMGEFVAAA